MLQAIPHQNFTLNANIMSGDNCTTCILFLCGGSLNIGKERFFDWQIKLQKAGINSVAFDYTGIPETKGSIKQQSLTSRIEEVISVLDWIQNKMSSKNIILYGVSMGGYTALGAIAERPDMVKKLILHAPAAYAYDAHHIPFDDTFTEIIRKYESWQNSLTFSWLKEYNYPVLFLYPEYDEVIPKGVTRKYQSIGLNKGDFLNCCLKNASHRCWSDSSFDKLVRDSIYEKVMNFISFCFS